MQDYLPQLVIGMLVMNASSIIAIITFWMKLGARLATGEAAHLLAQTAFAKAELLRDEFARYREEAAEKFLTSRELIDSENRMTKALEDLRKDMREQMSGVRNDVAGMNVRFDRFMQAEVERVRGG